MTIPERLWQDIDRIPGWMTRTECDWLFESAAECDSWTEIGCWAGRSAVATGMGLRKGALLQLVDPLSQPQFWDSVQYLRSFRADLRIIVAALTSEQAHTMLHDTAGVFVDAKHEYEHVKQDIGLWGPKCRILCGHDYGEPNPDLGTAEWGVKKAVDELLPGANRVAGAIWRRR